jgi:methylamine dehydrogenase accessory protein MauD
MNAVWVVSIVLQWVVIALLSLLVLSLIRQLGALNIRLNALRESSDEAGPALHTRLPAHELTLADGSTSTVGGPRENAALVVFFSPSCGACEALPEAITTVANEVANGETPLDMLAVVSSDRAAAARFAVEKRMNGVPVAASEDFPEHYVPRNGVPYAVALTPDGVVAARGKPKSLAHLREMAHAARHMAELATSHAVRDHEWGQSAPYWDASQQRP